MDYKQNKFKIFYLTFFLATEHTQISTVIAIKCTVYIPQMTEDSSIFPRKDIQTSWKI